MLPTSVISDNLDIITRHYIKVNVRLAYSVRIKTASGFTHRDIYGLFKALASSCFFGRYTAIARSIDSTDGAKASI